MRFLLILIKIIEICSYILPQTFREWTVIGIENNINRKLPYEYKIGNLPMILWYNKTNPQTIINNCYKHLGNTLRDSFIKDNELICPYHNTKYTNNDNLGTVKVSNGLLWWSYKSFNKNPPKMKEDNNNYVFEVESDFISVILNFICDFNGDDKTSRFYKKKLLMKKDRNYLIYKYPYTIIFNNNYMLNIVPIDMNNSRIYMTTKNNSVIKLDEIEKFKKYINKRFSNFRYKYLLLRDNNSYINKIYKCYKEYMYPDDYAVHHFLMNRNYY